MRTEFANADGSARLPRLLVAKPDALKMMGLFRDWKVNRAATERRWRRFKAKHRIGGRDLHPLRDLVRAAREISGEIT